MTNPMKPSDHEPKTVTIIVEGTPHEWPKNEKISYAQVVTLEVPSYSPTSGISYAVKYTRGEGHKPEGILSPGDSVKVKEGMVFSVSETGQS
jgi:Xaa-Pro aminopeptidase